MLKNFKVKVSNEQIADLKARLSRTIWPSEAANMDWEYGTNVAYLKETCAYWAQAFDWRVWEAKLNSYPQFIASVEDLDIHFVHIRSARPNALALIFTHGSPSSVF